MPVDVQRGPRCGGAADARGAERAQAAPRRAHVPQPAAQRREPSSGRCRSDPLVSNSTRPWPSASAGRLLPAGARVWRATGSPVSISATPGPACAGRCACGKRVVRAAQHQRVDLPGPGAEAADGTRCSCAHSASTCASSSASIAAARPSQGCSTNSAWSLQRIVQRANFGAGQRAARGQHGDAAGAAARHGRLERRLDADQRQLGVARAQQVDGRGGGRVAGHHQRLDAVLFAAGRRAMARERSTTKSSPRSP